MNLFETHRALLDAALEALKTRGHWTPFPEQPSPKVYGETAQAEGQAQVEALLGQDFPLAQPGELARIAPERSPWGVTLGTRYPECEPQALLTAAQDAEPAWQAAGPRGRVGVLLEAVARIHRQSHAFAHAVMLTTGQGPMMAFQAAGPHSQDRALEAIAVAWQAMSAVPEAARWDKPQGKLPALVMDKRFEIVGRGVALVIGCATFPTWNTFPGLFAALATGNPVIVKPHPNAILPAAMAVRVLREVLAEQGLPPAVVQLAATERPEFTQALATDPAVASIDFTGSKAFGQWLAEHARQARLYAELSGVNTVILESTDQYRAMLDNLAFSLCLYSGQMCTTPQNLFAPAGGIATDEGHKSFAELGADLAAAVRKITQHPKVGPVVLGALCAEATLGRLDQARAWASEGRARLLLDAEPLPSAAHPQFPQARTRTPLLLALDAPDEDLLRQECFGPISFLVAVPDAEQAATLAERLIRSEGALTLAGYTTDAAFEERLVRLSLRARVALSLNLTQGVYVNQAAAFSDFHGSGGNPAANASYAGLAFVADRFVVVQRRWHVRPEADASPAATTAPTPTAAAPAVSPATPASGA